jgi:hypothetical protein
MAWNAHRGHTGLFVTVSEALRLIRDAYSPRSKVDPDIWTAV